MTIHLLPRTLKRLTERITKSAQPSPESEPTDTPAERSQSQRAGDSGAETASATVDCRVLNVVFSTPNERPGGASRAGLLFGDHLASHTTVDNVKMQTDYDKELINDLELDHSVTLIPVRDKIRDCIASVQPSMAKHANTLVWTDLESFEISDYDVVHMHNPVPLFGMLAVALKCKLASVPYCVTTHAISKVPDIPESMEMSTLEETAFSIGFLRPYLWVLRNAACLFALSERDRTDLVERFPSQRIKVISNGVRLNPPTGESSASVEAATGIPPEGSLVLFVGRIAPDKGVGDMLDTYDRLEEDCTFVLAGPLHDSPYEERLEMYDSDKIQCLGYTNEWLLKKLYQRADLFFFPTRTDVFPLVVLEAMAAKSPVISTTVGGIPEQVTDATGILHEPGDHAAFSESINVLLRDEERRAEMGAAAFERVRSEFSWDAVSRTVAEEYQQLR